MEYAYRCAGRLGDRIRKIIKEIGDTCNICQQNGRSRLKPRVAIPMANDFNSTITLDLNLFRRKHVLWMGCAYTRLIEGVVLKDNTAGSVMNGVIEETYPVVSHYQNIAFGCKNTCLVVLNF